VAQRAFDVIEELLVGAHWDSRRLMCRVEQADMGSMASMTPWLAFRWTWIACAGFGGVLVLLGVLSGSEYGVAAGVIFMVLSSFYMWWGLAGKRLFGLAALALGTALCWLFVFALRWIYAV